MYALSAGIETAAGIHQLLSPIGGVDEVRKFAGKIAVRCVCPIRPDASCFSVSIGCQTKRITSDWVGYVSPFAEIRGKDEGNPQVIVSRGFPFGWRIW